MDLREIGHDGVNLIHLVQGTVKWRTLLNTIITFAVPQKAENILSADQ
jgi:hypothetical protein